MESSYWVQLQFPSAMYNMSGIIGFSDDFSKMMRDGQITQNMVLEFYKVQAKKVQWKFFPLIRNYAFVSNEISIVLVWW